MSDPCPPNPQNYPTDCDVLAAMREKAANRSAALPYSPQLLARAEKIRLLLLDVDGVLTDGRLWYGASGEEAKSFHTQDGFGLRLLQQLGIDTGVITARQSPMVTRRAKELKMRFALQNSRDKLQAWQKILAETGLKPFQVAYMGDDWLDLPLLSRAGLAIAPANAAPEVAEIVHYQTPRPGGFGAARDACDLLVAASGRDAELLQRYKSAQNPTD
ncbi:MAG: HAD hydrolase family protein [Desulfobulbaceae bacterium]|jgi:3-deoxy-D-manno-octulosonate 8-phosphate phosphatase (KDO 8-P phosphatase)|nr:HAD hydrolase family protein [Desulfobulbaceae bacterium]